LLGWYCFDPTLAHPRNASLGEGTDLGLSDLMGYTVTVPPPSWGRLGGGCFALALLSGWHWFDPTLTLPRNASLGEGTDLGLSDLMGYIVTVPPPSWGRLGGGCFAVALLSGWHWFDTLTLPRNASLGEGTDLGPDLMGYIVTVRPPSWGRLGGGCFAVALLSGWHCFDPTLAHPRNASLGEGTDLGLSDLMGYTVAVAPRSWGRLGGGCFALALLSGWRCFDPTLTLPRNASLGEGTDLGLSDLMGYTVTVPPPSWGRLGGG